MPRRCCSYASDKPDLRNPIVIRDATETFRGSGFRIFAGMIDGDPNVRVRAIPAPGGGNRAFCDRMNSWAQDEGQPGLGYIFFRDGEGAGPVARNLGPERTEALRAALGLGDGDAVFFVAGVPGAFSPFASAARLKIGEELGLTAKDCFEFCWITDFPMYELDEETGKIDFSHNPFSMPQGGLAALEKQDPLTINAFQYDIVCNGVELSSGAIRNHRPDIMYKAFAIAGYSAAEVETRFGGDAQRVQIRRAAAWRLGAGHRPHRHAARRHAQHARGRRLPDEPAGAGPADAGSGAGSARAAEGTAYPTGSAAGANSPEIEPAIRGGSARFLQYNWRAGGAMIGRPYAGGVLGR